MKLPQITIEEIAKTGSGGTPLRSEGSRFFGGTIPWIKSGELRDAPLVSSEETITEAALKESNAKIIPSGAVLIALYGATVGRTALLGFEATTNQAVCHIVPDPRLAEPKYVWYGLRSQLPELLKKRVGGAQPNISQQIIRSTKLPLPALREQRRIVELLDQADMLLRMRDEADSLAAQILPALFYKLFGDPPSNPKNFPRSTLGSVLAETAYGTSVSSNTDTKGIPVLRMNNITAKGRLNLEDLKHIELSEGEVQRHALEPGDLLFNRTNSKELVGKTALWRGAMKAVAASYLIRVRVDRTQVLPEFVWAWLNTSFIKQQLFELARRAVGMANINATELRSLPVLIPGLPLQKKFVNCLDQLHADECLRSKSRESIEVLFKAMLHRAFTGELTNQWRDVHMKELLVEMEQQARLLRSNPNGRN
jgi:type I restriction enzyme S subunit